MSQDVESERKNEGHGGGSGDHGDHGDAALALVTVDNVEKHVRRGRWVVSAFKAAVDVDASKELDQVIDGQLTPLDDTASITIHGHEVFISHVRTGQSG